MIRKGVYITSKQKEELGILGNLKASEHIRRAIDEYIKRMKDMGASSSESKIINKDKQNGK